MCNLLICFLKGHSFFHSKIVQKGMQACDLGHTSHKNEQWSYKNEKIMIEVTIVYFPK